MIAKMIFLDLWYFMRKHVLVRKVLSASITQFVQSSATHSYIELPLKCHVYATSNHNVIVSLFERFVETFIQKQPYISF